MVHNSGMPEFEIIRSETFDEWLRGLRDKRAIARINARLRQASLGNLGDTVPIGEGYSKCAFSMVPVPAFISPEKGRT